MQTISQVPTNIITGALGVGKTTLIQSLLKQKPANERWAVLVNEFGEVGIDGAMMSGHNETGVFIKEVPGGCMCCTSGLPMQIALNLLLAQAKPDRLLIEPTGLGHPKEVLQTLSEDHYKDVLDIHATLTLIDPRKLSDERWRSHPTFQEQVQIADVIVVTKSDKVNGEYLVDVQDYIHNACGVSMPIVVADKGQIPLSTLATSINSHTHTHEHEHEHEQDHSHAHHHHEHHHNDEDTTVLNTPDTGVISVRNEGEGFHSRGWICAKDTEFDFDYCESFLRSLPVERLKAVLITEQGPYSFNVSEDTVDVRSLESADDSRLEFIVDDEKKADELALKITKALGL